MTPEAFTSMAADAFPMQGSWSFEYTKKLMDLLGNPQDSVPCIHIAGTNGKGSASAMTASILRNAGYQIGLHTSPALIHFNERIRLNDDQISDKDIIRLFKVVTAAISRIDSNCALLPPEFALITAISFLYFSEAHVNHKCDFMIQEVGLGGKWDPTNTIHNPLVSVIMPVSLDHMAILGNTIEQIAYEKAGIIKAGVPVIVAPQSSQAVRILEDVCLSVGSACVVAKPAVCMESKPGIQLIRRANLLDEKPIKLALSGHYQLSNVGTVFSLIDTLRTLGCNIPETAIEKGLGAVSWPARLQLLQEDPIILLDGAHNVHGAKELACTVNEFFPEKNLLLLCGMMADKDCRGILSQLLPYARSVCLVPPPGPRALAGTEAISLLDDLTGKNSPFSHVHADYLEDLRGAVQHILAMQEAEGNPVLIFGSLYLAGSILSIFSEISKQPSIPGGNK